MLSTGDIKRFQKVVLAEDIAAFPNQIVHEVCATFALARDIEWCSRLFLLDFLKEGEEGIGTELHIKHISPALVGEKLEIQATVNSFIDNRLLCDIIVQVGERYIATGSTGQKIIDKNKFKNSLSDLKNG